MPERATVLIARFTAVHSLSIPAPGPSSSLDLRHTGDLIIRPISGRDSNMKALTTINQSNVSVEHER